MASAPNKRLKGARITTDMVTVTGTENLLMAATLADGETVLENAAQEPEVTDLAEHADRHGRAASKATAASRIHIQGVEALHAPAGGHRIIPDRIEAGTFLCAVAATGGDVTLRGRARRPSGRGHRQAARSRREHRVPATTGSACAADGRLKAVSFRTSEYPLLPDRHAGPVHGR